MTNGTSQGLFIVVAIIIFGIFVTISYVLFRNELKPTLANIFTDRLEQAEDTLKRKDLQELEIGKDDISNFSFEKTNGVENLDLLRIKKNNEWEKIDSDTPSLISFSVKDEIRYGDVGEFEEVQPYLNITFKMSCLENITETCRIGYKYTTDEYIGIADNFKENIPENLTYSLNIHSENYENISAIYMNDVLISNTNDISVSKLFQAMNDLDSITVKSNNKQNYLFALNPGYSRHTFAANLMNRARNEMKIETNKGIYKLPVDISLIQDILS
ncbi:hypothetical protein ACFVRF_11835 [Enterococcus faecalis]|uniref:hypothetical protein n=1 Tax=Enterococcus faecalis TaxID=1351 RepID=UPI002224D2E5|nr:hypothetical protein [Enterococcus faecalis]UYY18776.1 hypothetical protein OLM03_08275 [Enterococcus faecalis]UYY21348.1 hypothetical protein OLM07_08245 [Enterococcus faecalis]